MVRKEEVREQTELVGLPRMSGKADSRQANRTMSVYQKL